MTPNRAAIVIDTLRFLAGGWLKDQDDTDWCLEASDLIDAYDFTESGWTCPLCQEVVCDGGCPLESLREA